jgi:hypothetical protein
LLLKLLLLLHKLLLVLSHLMLLLELLQPLRGLDELWVSVGHAIVPHLLEFLGKC